MNEGTTTGGEPISQANDALASNVAAKLLAARISERKGLAPASNGEIKFSLESLLSTLSACEASSTQSLLEALFSDDLYPPNAGDALYLRLQWIDLIFDQIETGCEYDAGLLPWILQFRFPVGRLVLLDDSLLSNPNHPVRVFFAMASILAVGWSSGVAGVGKKLLEAIQEVLSSVKQLPAQEKVKVFDAFNLGGSKINDLMVLANRSEKRVCEVKVGELRAAKADALVTTFLNKVMGGKKIPKIVVDFVQGPWRETMRVIYLKCGNRSIEWTEIGKLTITLISSVAPKSEADRKRLYRIIPRLPNQIKQHLGNLENAQITTQQFLDSLDDVYVRLLKKEKIETVEVALLAPVGNNQFVEVSMCKRLKKKLDVLRVGQWYKYTLDNGEVQRLRLAMKMEDIGQLLFVNIEGRNALSKSFEAVAYYLALKLLEALEKESFFEEAYQKVCQSLREPDFFARLSDDQKNIEKAENKTLEAQGERVVGTAQTRAKQVESVSGDAEREEGDKVHTAASPSIAESGPSAAPVPPSRTNKQQKEAALDKKIAEVWSLRAEYIAQNKKQKNVQEARLQVEALAIGSWVNYIDETSVEKRCKLAAKLRSADKFIFVDRAGIKVLVCSLDYLVAKLVAEEMTLLESGPLFESALEKVVGGLRESR